MTAGEGRKIGPWRGWLTRWFGGSGAKHASQCPRCLSEGSLEVKSSPAQDQRYPEPRYVHCTACDYRFREAHLRLPRLCFPTVGLSGSGKTHWLVTGPGSEIMRGMSTSFPPCVTS